jgi:hypothetical protein
MAVRDAAIRGAHLTDRLFAPRSLAKSRQKQKKQTLLTAHNLSIKSYISARTGSVAAN